MHLGHFVAYQGIFFALKNNKALLLLLNDFLERPGTIVLILRNLMASVSYFEDSKTVRNPMLLNKLFECFVRLRIFFTNQCVTFVPKIYLTPLKMVISLSIGED